MIIIHSNEEPIFKFIRPPIVLLLSSHFFDNVFSKLRVHCEKFERGIFIITGISRFLYNSFYYKNPLYVSLGVSIVKL